MVIFSLKKIFDKLIINKNGKKWFLFYDICDLRDNNENFFKGTQQKGSVPV